MDISQYSCILITFSPVIVEMSLRYLISSNICCLVLSKGCSRADGREKRHWAPYKDLCVEVGGRGYMAAPKGYQSAADMCIKLQGEGEVSIT